MKTDPYNPENHGRPLPADCIKPIFTKDEWEEAFLGKELTRPLYRELDQNGKPLNNAKNSDPALYTREHHFSNSQPYITDGADPEKLVEIIKGERVLLSSYRISEGTPIPEFDRILGNIIVTTTTPIEIPYIKSIEGIIVIDILGKNGCRKRTKKIKPITLNLPNLKFLGGLNGPFQANLPKLEVVNYLLKSPYPISVPALKWIGGEMQFPGHKDLLEQVGRKRVNLPIPNSSWEEICQEIKELGENLNNKVFLKHAHTLFDQNANAVNIKHRLFKEWPNKWWEKSHIDHRCMIQTLETGETIFLGSLIIEEDPDDFDEYLIPSPRPTLDENEDTVIIPYDYVVGDIIITTGFDTMDTNTWEEERLFTHVEAPNLKKVGGKISSAVTLIMPVLTEIGGLKTEGEDVLIHMPHLETIEDMLKPRSPAVLEFPKLTYIGGIDNFDTGASLELPKLKTIAGTAISDDPEWYNPETISHAHWVTNENCLDQYYAREAPRQKFLKIAREQPSIEI